MHVYIPCTQSQAHTLHIYCTQARKPATYISVRTHAPRSVTKAHTYTLRQVQHSVIHTHTTPRSWFRSASPKLPHTHGTASLNLPQVQCSIPISRKRQNSVKGRGFPQAWPPLPIQQVLQVLGAVLLGAGAEPGCPGCREEILRRNGRTLGPRWGKAGSGAGGCSPASSTACWA